MILEVQKFLRTHGLSSRSPHVPILCEQYSIVVRRHGRYDNLVCFKYHMIDSPMGERIVQECRGLILDEANNWAVVSRPFDKFFNYGSGHTPEIDWDTASVQEKLDGSLMTLFHYRGEWHVQSSGTADAGGSVNGAMIEWREHGKLILPFPTSFAAYFWQIANLTSMSIRPSMTDVPKDVCFMFEMMGHLNRIIVKHETSKLVLIGARLLISGQELAPKSAAELLPGFVPVVKSFPLQTLKDIYATFDHMNPLEQEGYVVVDADFNRVKVKSPAYVALHHAKGEEVTPKRLLAIAVAGESDEWVVHFDEYKEGMAIVREKLEAFIAEVEDDYKRISEEVGPDASQKSFALFAKATKCSAALFQVRSGKVESIRKYIRGMQLDKLIKILYLNQD